MAAFRRASPRSSASDASCTSMPATRTEPPTSAPVPRCSPRRAEATVDLPEPDSPTRPSAAPPFASRKDRPSTARSDPNPTVRSVTSTKLIRAPPVGRPPLQHVRDGVGDDHEEADDQDHADDHRQVDDVHRVHQLLDGAVRRASR